MKTQGTEVLIVCLYVDDLIYVGNSQKMIDEFKSHMVQEFEMTDLNLTNYFLGLEVTHSNKEIFISQKKYISDLLDRFGLKDCNSVGNPMGTNFQLMMVLKKLIPIMIEV